MAGRMRGLLERLLARRRAATHDGVSDAELLLRFTRDRDEAAFELLVWRHGAMVLGLCRRAVRDEQLAEDAFQAVFLVLARKAGAIRGNLGGWLFRVARRVAARASKRQVIVQAVIETQAAPVPDAVERDELASLLDAEIARLPERLRRPVVLCYLGDRTTEDAARELGCPRGTVLSRLATARKRLAERLTRRGVTLPAALATGAVSHRLVSSATAAAPTFRSGSLALSPATQLADGVLRSMSRASLLIALGGVALAATLVTGVGWVAAQQGPKTAVAPGAAPAALPPPNAAPKPAQPDLAEVRRQTDERVKKLEQFAETLRVEVEAMEKQIELLVRANGVTDEGRVTELRKQMAEAEEEYRRASRELAKLEAEVTVLKKVIEDKNPPQIDLAPLDHEVGRDGIVRQREADLEAARQALARVLTQDGPETIRMLYVAAIAAKNLQESKEQVRARLADAMRTTRTTAAWQRLVPLMIDLEIKKAFREKLREERDVVKKLVHSNAIGTLDIAGFRVALNGPREMLARVERELLLLRAQRAGVTFSEVTETDTKLDAILRELAALRKDVQELKGRSK